MNLIDIHSHILPEIDDGAQDANEAIELLQAMKSQGITDVIATPHFIASEHNLEEYLSDVAEAKKLLEASKKDLDLPNVYLGSEVYYFAGIGKSKAISLLCLNNTKYLLLELATTDINKYVLEDIANLRNNLDIIPIIAHIERYSKEKGFRKLLKLIDSGVCLAQLNASSLFLPVFKKAAYKLIKKGYISFIATDTHSIKYRPPMLTHALAAIETNLGKSYKVHLLQNLEAFQKEITSV